MANAPVLHWSVTSPSPTTEAASRATWEAIRRYHVSQGYHDIAYNHGGGNDGAILTGRGWDRDSAANGTDANGVNRNPGSRVFCWLGGPGDVPTPAAFRAMRLWAEEARRRGYTAAVVDHKGLGVQTSCAGPDIPEWIAAGMPVGPEPQPEPRVTEDEPMLMIPTGDGLFCRKGHLYHVDANAVIDLYPEPLSSFKNVGGGIVAPAALDQIIAQKLQLGIALGTIK